MRRALVLVLVGCAAEEDLPADRQGDVDPDRFRLAWRHLLQDDPVGELHAVWGSEADDVWVVGGRDDVGVALHGRADALADVVLPDGTPTLRTVHGTGPRNVWLGGDDGLLLRWDGRRWSTPARAEGTIRGLHVAGASDVLVVGGDEPGPPRAWRWDGEALTPAKLPLLATTGELNGVTRRDGVGIAVGTHGLVVDLDTGRRLPTGTVDDLLDVDAAGGVVRVVGGDGDGLLARLEPDGLVVEATAPSPLRALDDLGQGTVVAAGDRGVEGLLDARVGTWTEVDPFTLQTVRDLWVSPLGDAWAVGGHPGDTGRAPSGFVAYSPAP